MGRLMAYESASPLYKDQSNQLCSFCHVTTWVYRKLGWDPIAGESHLDAMLRGEILTALVALGHEETKQEGLKRFNIFLNDRSTQLLPADVRKVVLWPSLSLFKFG